ncbi:hypothetical protein BESB_058340 [Besnoitia besnoiti]|uniref:Transmembrane protein n=1 Tax=Besnoitia besnoiti TaxID=94643 RepID=A0A2A9MH80_BESBE|nr:hypothetical protein BESB_058340 [Besnoitia besnoiti]PFH34947.1 hypothetical protein BESB_058340 [Besnoitia besnoiti]
MEAPGGNADRPRRHLASFSSVSEQEEEAAPVWGSELAPAAAPLASPSSGSCLSSASPPASPCSATGGRVLLCAALVVCLGTLNQIAGKIRSKPLGKYDYFVSLCNAVLYSTVYSLTLVLAVRWKLVPRENLSFVWPSLFPPRPSHPSRSPSLSSPLPAPVPATSPPFSPLAAASSSSASAAPSGSSLWSWSSLASPLLPRLALAAPSRPSAVPSPRATAPELGAWRFFVLTGLCDACGNVLGFIAQPFVPGPLFSLATQAIVPFSCLCSLVLLRRRYSLPQLAALLLVMLGFFVAWYPLVASEPAGLASVPRMRAATDVEPWSAGLLSRRSHHAREAPHGDSQEDSALFSEVEAAPHAKRPEGKRARAVGGEESRAPQHSERRKRGEEGEETRRQEGAEGDEQARHATLRRKRGEAPPSSARGGGVKGEPSIGEEDEAEKQQRMTICREAGHVCRFLSPSYFSLVETFPYDPSVVVPSFDDDDDVVHGLPPPSWAGASSSPRSPRPPAHAAESSPGVPPGAEPADAVWFYMLLVAFSSFPTALSFAVKEKLLREYETAHARRDAGDADADVRLPSHSGAMTPVAAVGSVSEICEVEDEESLDAGDEEASESGSSTAPGALRLVLGARSIARMRDRETEATAFGGAKMVAAGGRQDGGAARFAAEAFQDGCRERAASRHPGALTHREAGGEGLFVPTEELRDTSWERDVLTDTHSDLAAALSAAKRIPGGDTWQQEGTSWREDETPSLSSNVGGESPCVTQTLHVLVICAHGSVFQLLWILLSIPLSVFVGQAYVSYAVVNIVFNLSLIGLVSAASSLLTFVCMKATLPLSIILYATLPWPLFDPRDVRVTRETTYVPASRMWRQAAGSGVAKDGETAKDLTSRSEHT